MEKKKRYCLYRLKTSYDWKRGEIIEERIVGWLFFKKKVYFVKFTYAPNDMYALSRETIREFSENDILELK